MNEIDPMQWLKKFFLKPLEHPFFWIALVILVVYSGTIFYDIVYLDDNVLVVDHYQFNKNLANISQAFYEDIFRSPFGEGSFYRPIERLTFMFDAQFGQKSIILMSHISNVFFHIISICLLFSLFLNFKIKKETALLFSLIFAVHPLTAQTVAFISGRNDPLLAIFIFPALIFFLKYLKTQKRKYYFWHLTFFVLALFTKETAIILPLVCLSYILFFVNLKKVIINYKSYLFLSVGWTSALFFWFMIRREVLNNLVSNADIHPIPSIIKNLPATIPAIGKVILPIRLSVFPVLKDMTMTYGFVVLAILFFWFILSKNKNYRWILFGISWFLLFIMLTLIKPSNTTPEFSENRIYIPMFGFIFLLLGLGKLNFLDKIKNKINPEFQKKIIIILGIIVIIIFSSITMYRNRYYKDKISFWQNAVTTSPSFAFNHNNLGAMYYLEEKLDEAEKEYKIAIEINNKEPMAHNNLGIIYKNKEKFQEADEEYDKELSFNPYYFAAYANKAILYGKMGRDEDALNAWKKSLEINPRFAKALYNIFTYYYQKQDKENAIFWINETQRRGIPLLPEMQKMLNPFAR